MLSSWHVVLSQTARQHGLFFMFTLMSLVLFIHAEKTGKRFIPYGLALVAASHTSYWGVFVVLPAHFFATYLTRNQLNHWKPAAIAQIAAGLTTLVYVVPIIRGYHFITEGGSKPWPPLSVPYFGSILVNFSAAHPGQLEIYDFPWVTIVTLVVSVAIAIGARHWAREDQAFPRWLGLCCALFLILLFLAYLAGASHMAWAPMQRKFAILHIPLLIAFLFGVSRINSTLLRYTVFCAWAITASVFGVRYMSSDLYKGSRLVAEQVAQLPGPITTFVNFDTLLPAEQGSLAFLLERMKASKGREFRSFDFRSKPALNISESGITCFSYMREGNFLWAELNNIFRSGSSRDDPDAKFNHMMHEIASQLQETGWKNVVSRYYPGRISFKVDCFQRGPGQSRNDSLKRSF
jgi:hypothetical protein